MREGEIVAFTGRGTSVSATAVACLIQLRRYGVVTDAEALEPETTPRGDIEIAIAKPTTKSGAGNMVTVHSPWSEAR